MIAALAWQRPQLLWLTLLVLLAAALAGASLDRWTTRTLSRGARATILTLRFVGIALLALALLRPAVALRVASARRGVVAVLVDESASMSVVDTARTPAELVPLAAALEPNIAAARDARLAGLGQSLDTLGSDADELSRAAGEVEYAKLSQRPLEAAETRLRDTAARFEEHRSAAAMLAAGTPAAESIATALRQINVATATTRPATLLSPLRAQAELLTTLQTHADERLLSQSLPVRSGVDRLAKDSRLQLIQQCLEHAEPALGKHFSVEYFGFGASVSTLISPGDLHADQAGTDLAGAVRELRNRLAGERLAAVVICSDGRQTLPVSADPILAGDLPIYVVNPASARVSDIALARLNLPRAVRVGSINSASVDLVISGPRESVGTLTLIADQQSSSTRVTLNGPTTRAAMTFSAQTAGPLEVTASINSQNGEATIANNQIRDWTRSVNQPLRVGVLGDPKSPNLESLRAALRGDAMFSLQTLAASTFAPLDDAMLDQDVLALADLPYGALSDANWWAIERYVHDRGGAVLIASSNPDVYDGYTSHESTAALVPWSSEDSPTLRQWPGSMPSFRLLPPNPDAVDELHWSDDPQSSRAAWRQLPLLSRTLALPELGPTARALVVEAQTRSAVLVTQAVGAGRADLIGADELLRLSSSTLAPGAAWRALLNHASGGAYAIDDGVLAIDADSLTPEPNRPLHLRLKVRAGQRAELDEPFDRPLLQINHDGRRYFSKLLNSPGDPFPNRSEVTLPSVPRGEYEATLIWADRKVVLPLTVGETLSEELANVSADPANLASLVTARGAMLSIEQLPGIAARIEAAADLSPAVVSYPLWNSPWFFVLVVSCFGVDWTLRQRAGLA